MHKIKITAIRKADYKDLQQKYENPIQHACDIQEGQVFIANGWQRPEGMCESAWESISPFVMTLAHGGENIYDGWMRNPKSAMISCNDGFRPVSFLIEVMDEKQEKDVKDNKLNPFKLDFDSYILQSEPEKQENGKLWNKLEAEGLIVGTGENKNRTYSLKR